MLLTAVRDEFTFYSECRKLSPKTVKKYGKQIDYFLRYLESEKGVPVCPSSANVKHGSKEFCK